MLACINTYLLVCFEFVMGRKKKTTTTSETFFFMNVQTFSVHSFSGKELQLHHMSWRMVDHIMYLRTSDHCLDETAVKFKAHAYSSKSQRLNTAASNRWFCINVVTDYYFVRFLYSVNVQRSDFIHARLFMRDFKKKKLGVHFGKLCDLVNLKSLKYF